jgi:4-amino-4-deoxy-L-arabinose transferase-like glycosyltransferase
MPRVIDRPAAVIDRPLQSDVNYSRALLLVLLLALSARLVLVSSLASILSLETSGYDSYAANIIDGNGYTRFDDRTGDSDLPPMYPLFLVAVYQLSGRGVAQVEVAQALLECVTIATIFLIGRKIVDAGTGLIAAALVAFYPYTFFQSLTVNDTTLFTLFLAVAIWLCYRAASLDSRFSGAATGAALGFAALTKPWASLIVPILMLWWLHAMGPRRASRLVVLAIVGWLVVVTPWIARNTQLHGRPAFISTNDGSNLYQGNNPCVVDYLQHGWDAQWVDCLTTPPSGLDELALNQWYRREALTYLGSHPGDWAELFGVKLAVLWSPILMPSGLPPGVTSIGDPVRLYYTPIFNLGRWLYTATFTPLLVLGIIGLWLSIRRGLAIGPLLTVLATNTVTYVVFHPSTRYRSPADPFLLVLAAIPLAALWTRWRRRLCG